MFSNQLLAKLLRLIISSCHRSGICKALPSSQSLRLAVPNYVRLGFLCRIQRLYIPDCGYDRLLRARMGHSLR